MSSQPLAVSTTYTVLTRVTVRYSVWNGHTIEGGSKRKTETPGDSRRDFRRYGRHESYHLSPYQDTPNRPRMTQDESPGPRLHKKTPWGRRLGPHSFPVLSVPRLTPSTPTLYTSYTGPRPSPPQGRRSTERVVFIQPRGRKRNRTT